MRNVQNKPLTGYALRSSILLFVHFIKDLRYRPAEKSQTLTVLSAAPETTAPSSNRTGVSARVSLCSKRVRE